MTIDRYQRRSLEHLAEGLQKLHREQLQLAASTALLLAIDVEQDSMARRALLRFANKHRDAATLIAELEAWEAATGARAEHWAGISDEHLAGDLPLGQLPK